MARRRGERNRNGEGGEEGRRGKDQDALVDRRAGEAKRSMCIQAKDGENCLAVRYSHTAVRW